MKDPQAVPIALSLGFRPFFLLGCLSGVVALLGWLFALSNLPYAPSLSPLWHAHEMIHGFAIAIVFGFLATASQNWTGIRGIRGGKLLAAVIVWFLGRLVFLIPMLPAAMTALVDLSFAPLMGILLIPYLGIASQRRNAIFLVLIALLWFSSLAYHLDALEIEPGVGRAGLYLGVYVLVTMIVVIGSRVVPFFSERALPGYTRRHFPRVDQSMIVLSMGFAVSHYVSEGALVTHILAAMTGGFVLFRVATWFDRRIIGVPILWILYLGCSWVGVGYILTALSGFGVVAPNIGVHALAVGGIGTMIVAMVSRVSLGHTGRPLVASRVIVGAYVAIALAAFVRVVGPLLAPEQYLNTVYIAGALWILSFVILITVYAPILLARRPDGRPD